MFKTIQNEEHYYSIPGVNSNRNHQHLPYNMIYRAMIYLPATFMAAYARQILREKWGIDLSNQQTSVGLRKLLAYKYITRVHNGDKIYVYTRTSRYIQEMGQYIVHD